MARDVYKPECVRKITDSEECKGISLEVKKGQLILTQRKGIVKIPIETVSGFAREMCDMADVYGKKVTS